MIFREKWLLVVSRNVTTYYTAVASTAQKYMDFVMGSNRVPKPKKALQQLML